MTITCGIDWAEAHHDVAVMNSDGTVLGGSKIDTGIVGFGELMSLLAEHCEDPRVVPIAIGPTRTSSWSRCKPPD